VVVLHGIDYFCRLSKLSGKELAILLGCKQQKITTWKNGSRDIPKHHLLNLCDIFTVPCDKRYLLETKHLSEMDKYEIETILRKAKLKNFEENISDMEEIDEDQKSINNSIRHTLQSNIRIAQQTIEATKLANQIKFVLCSNLMDDQNFYKPREQIELVDTLEKNALADATIAEAMRVISESAKTSLKTKNNAHRKGDFSIAKRSRTRYKYLNNLNNMTLDKLADENRVQIMGYFKQKNNDSEEEFNYILFVSMSGGIFYKSTDKYIARRHKYIGELDNPSENPERQPLKFNEAQKILERYLQKEEG
jgi:transcriptional regulator with XRE-family HTH domain